TAFSAFTSPRPITSTTAGVSLSATGSVRSDTPGNRVCLLITEETQAGATVNQEGTCVTSTTAWSAFAPVNYTTAQTGDRIQVSTYEAVANPGDSFEVDGLQLLPGV